MKKLYQVSSALLHKQGGTCKAVESCVLVFEELERAYFSMMQNAMQNEALGYKFPIGNYGLAKNMIENSGGYLFQSEWVNGYSITFLIANIGCQ